MLSEGEFLSPYSGLVDGVTAKLARKGLAQRSLFGVAIKKSPEPLFIDVLVNSPGGSISLLMQRLGFVNYLRSKNIFLKCYISEAHSAAFTFVIAGCTTRILIKDGKMSQHRAFYSSYSDDKKHESPVTRILSYKLAKIEAAILKKNYIEWYKISRGDDLKEFTEEELKEHGIIHDVF